MAQARTGDNNFGVAQFVVGPSIGGGATHTSIQQAVTDAIAAGTTTVYIKAGVYTENITLSSGVSLISYDSFGLDPDDIATRPVISGTITINYSGDTVLSGLMFQTNGAVCITVSGNVQSKLLIDNCFFYCINANGILFSPTSSGSYLRVSNCQANLLNSNAFFTSTSMDPSGIIELYSLQAESTDLSQSASTISSGIVQIVYCDTEFPITTSSTAGLVSKFSTIDMSAFNVICLTLGGSGTNTLSHSKFLSGSASAISIGGTATLDVCSVNSSNTNAITGGGTINYAPIDFTGTSNTINTSTKNPLPQTVEMGGTGVASNTAYAVLCGGTTSTAPIQSIESVDTSGQVLTSNGASMLPTFQAVGGSTGTQAFTPVLKFGGGTTGITYSEQVGEYIQIGPIVFFYVNIQLSSKGSSTGAATIEGLPVTTNANANIIGLLYFSALTLTALYTNVSVYNSDSSTVLNLLQSGSAQAAAGLADTNFANNSTLIFNGWYFTT